MTYYHSKLYPLDYPDQIDGSQFEILDAIELIRIQARDAAIRLVMGNRITSQSAARTQGERAKTYPMPIPLNAVGQRTSYPSNAGGRIGFLGGGRGHVGVSGINLVNSMLAFTYSNEVLFKTGAELTFATIYMGTTWSPYNGYFVGGATPFGWTDKVDGVNYRNMTVRTIGKRLTRPMIAVTGGIQNRVKGVVLGGTKHPHPSARDGLEFNYTSGRSPYTVPIGSILSGPRSSTHNGTSNRLRGYMYGGASEHNFHWATALNTIEGYTISTRSANIIGAQLSDRQMIHGAVGNSTRGYIAGGTGPTPITSWFGDKISRLSYDGEVLTALGQRLFEPRVCTDGIGSATRGYFAGGDTAASLWVGTQDIDRLDYGTETLTRTGARLVRTIADQGGVSDYSGGFR